MALHYLLNYGLLAFSKKITSLFVTNLIGLFPARRIFRPLHHFDLVLVDPVGLGNEAQQRASKMTQLL